MSQHFKSPYSRLTRLVSMLVAALLIGTIGYIGSHYRDYTQAATPGTLYVAAPSGSWKSGSNVSVMVREDSGAVPVDSAQFFLKYDPGHLQFVGLSDGEFTAAANDVTSTPGVVQAFRSSSSGLTGDRAVAIIRFKVLATGGSTSLSIDQANSYLVGKSKNFLGTTSGGTYAVAAPRTVAADAALSLTPASSRLTPGSTVTVSVKVGSPAQGTYVIQPILMYPADKLQFVSFQNNTAAFPSVIRSTTSTAGQLEFVRSVSGGGQGFIGTADVLAVTFKVIGADGTTAIVGLKDGSLVLNGAGKNILRGTTDATFVISSRASPPASSSLTNSPAYVPTPRNYAQIHEPSDSLIALGASAALGGSVMRLAAMHDLPGLMTRYSVVAFGAVIGLLMIGTIFWRLLRPRPLSAGDRHLTYDPYGSGHRADTHPTAAEPALITPKGVTPLDNAISPEHIEAAQSTDVIDMPEERIVLAEPQAAQGNEVQGEPDSTVGQPGQQIRPEGPKS